MEVVHDFAYLLRGEVPAVAAWVAIAWAIAISPDTECEFQLRKRVMEDWEEAGQKRAVVNLLHRMLEDVGSEQQEPVTVFWVP